MTKYAEQIAAFEAKRKTLLDANETIMNNAASEGATLDASQKEEFDENEANLKEIDEHLSRLRTMEKAAAATATPIDNVKSSKDGSDRRGGIQVKAQPKLAPGVGFARYVRCHALANVNNISAIEVARAAYGEDSEVYGVIIKAAVPGATVADATWAGALVGTETSLFADFVEFLRPWTIIGRFGTDGIPALRQVPFRTPLISQTSGGQGFWVGEGKAKPLTKFDFARTTLEPLKVANIAVATMETLRDSSPSAEILIRDGLRDALVERMDITFIDPAAAAVAGISPASITNGVTPIPSTGNTADNIRDDVRAIFNAFIAANNRPTSGVWIMTHRTALALSLIQNPLGQKEFPGVTMTGGIFEGLPVITSEHVPLDTVIPIGDHVVLANANDIYIADEGGVSIDMSREASLEMDDAPTNTSDVPTATSLVSMFQTNSVAFLAERTISWKKRRTESVQLLDQVNWGQ